MKHFIYLTEDKIYYIRKTGGRSGGYYFLGSRPVDGLKGVEAAMGSLLEVYNLKGRKAVLVIGAKAKVHRGSIPVSGKKTVLQMAEKQLLVSGKEEEQLMAADLFSDDDQNMLQGVLYTVEKDWLRAAEAAARKCRMHLGAVLPAPAVLASFPDSKEYKMGEGPIILVHLSEDFISLCEIEDNRCCYWEKLELKPEIFSKMGEEPVLMEELKDQIVKMQGILENDREDFKLCGILLENECLKTPKACARYLSGLLHIPCIALKPGSLWEKQARPERLKKLWFDPNVKYQKDETLLRRIAGTDLPVKPVCVCIILLVLAVMILPGIWPGGNGLYDPGFIQTERQKAGGKEEQTQPEDKQKELMTEIKGFSDNTFPGTALFSALDLALKPEMGLSSLEYFAEEGRIRIQLLTADTRDISGFIQTMEENGFSMEQSSWQKQEMEVSAQVLLKPGKKIKSETRKNAQIHLSDLSPGQIDIRLQDLAEAFGIQLESLKIEETELMATEGYEYTTFSLDFFSMTRGQAAAFVDNIGKEGDGLWIRSLELEQAETGLKGVMEVRYCHEQKE